MTLQGYYTLALRTLIWCMNLNPFAVHFILLQVGVISVVRNCRRRHCGSTGRTDDETCERNLGPLCQHDTASLATAESEIDCGAAMVA